MPVHVPSEEEVLGYMESLSNWGRWGPDDQLGTLNHITAEKRVAASRLVREGVTVTCSRPIVSETAPDVPFQFQRFMVDSGEGRDTDPPEIRRTRYGAGEYIGMVFHGHTITHVDSLAHYSWRGKMYNGVSSNMVTSRHGARSHAIDVARDGIVTRGVLLDIARLKGKRWLDPDEPVFPEDLDAAEKDAGLTVEKGDLLLVRTGNYRRRLDDGPFDPNVDGGTSCHVACIPWFHRREIAMLGTDTSNDLRPDTTYDGIMSPLHTLSLVFLGMCLIDNANLEELARACEERGRWEFMLCMGPLRLINITGTPVNPIAVF